MQRPKLHKIVPAPRGKKKGRSNERPKSREETPKEGTTDEQAHRCRNAQIIDALHYLQLLILQCIPNRNAERFCCGHSRTIFVRRRRKGSDLEKSTTKVQKGTSGETVGVAMNPLGSAQ